jgi:hypothetical protein
MTSKHVIARNGDNKVDPELPPIWWLFLKKIAHPFYVFQLFSAIVWYEPFFLPCCLVSVRFQV